MKKLQVWLLFGVVAVLGIGVMKHNALVDAEESVESAWSNVAVQLQRRMDLVPNLVAVVKGYAEHEKSLLIAVTKARAEAATTRITGDMGPDEIMKAIRAQGEFASALSRLMMIVERYPNLKADQRFRDLQVQLEGTENRIAYARSEYNEKVKRFNSMMRRFPGSILASFMGLEKFPYFVAKEGADEVPNVEL